MSSLIRKPEIHNHSLYGQHLRTRSPGGKEALDLIKNRQVMWVPALLNPAQYTELQDTPARFRDGDVGAILYTTATSVGSYPEPTTRVAKSEPLITIHLKTQGNDWRPIASLAKEDQQAEARQLPCIVTAVGDVALSPPVTNMQLIRLAEIGEGALSAVPPQVIEEYGPLQPLFLRPYARTL